MTVHGIGDGSPNGTGQASNKRWKKRFLRCWGDGRRPRKRQDGQRGARHRTGMPFRHCFEASRPCVQTQTEQSASSDIRIMDAGETDGTFHARFTSMAREYTYLIKRAEELTAFDSGHVWAVRELPPEELLNEYATVIAGTHDFTTFCSSKDECSSKMRDIYESVWTMGKDVFGYDLLRYRITGNAFLYHMVRSLVGTMVEFAACGKGAASFRAALEAKDRRACGRTASPYGLYLTRISYDPEEYQWFEEANENG